MSHPTTGVRLGRIGYLNVLPLFLPLETGRVRHDLTLVAGPPSYLNTLMADGRLDISGVSSIEYGRRPERYLLVPDLSIGSRGPVQSVLLLSRLPLERLDGRTILVSSQTHTSAALLRLLLKEHLRVATGFATGDASRSLAEGERPEAILAIGDEALRLRRHPDYPHTLDLGEAWRQWTGLPFIFGLWAVRREALAERPEALWAACGVLAQAKAAGLAMLETTIARAAADTPLSVEELRSYFAGLSYDLGPEEQQGLNLFYRKLVGAGIIASAPELAFVESSTAQPAYL
ncbi:MAG TPA: menaquinone biosynthesis protein [Desulfovibrio sp.]|jgi:chorismate dehydratase|uniref:menaquinone biosynthetic enzyme MqnA/MqnD family protein n=1 Tax=Desulfovibrio TaxID=872 RepID=UPI000406E9A2|nr:MULTISPECIES: menaquinone biosynthesis protein [Desulfovibrio]HMM37822.1 menaquinone biosynthesis protein [Desulfovibrio sp.]